MSVIVLSFDFGEPVKYFLILFLNGEFIIFITFSEK
jgi:hypothetical protein